MFNSSILMKKENSINESINNLVADNDRNSYMYSLLEFNDRLHEIDVLDKISYYRNLKEGATEETSLAIMNENIISNIAEKLGNIIAAIIKFIKDVAKKLFGFGRSEKKTYYDNIKYYSTSSNTGTKNNNTSDNNSNKWGVNSNEIKEINIYVYPKIRDIDTQKFRVSIKNITDRLHRVCNNKTDDSEQASDVSLNMAYKTLAKLIRKYVNVPEKSDSTYNEDIVDSHTFSEFIRTEVCFIKQKSMTYREWLSYYMKLRFSLSSTDEISKKISEFESDLKDAEKVVINASFSSTSQSKHASDLVAQIRAIITSYTSFIQKIASMEVNSLKYHNNLRKSSYQEIKHESTMIHGEPFNSDTLFDNEDIRDFNRTEWLDLNLTTESYELKFELLEMSKRIAVKEALILSDDKPNKFARLVAMREAEEKKFGDTVKNIIDRIRKFVTDFIDKIKSKCFKNSKTINRNMAFVNKPVTLQNIRSTGDIIAGMYRVQKKISVIPFNYQSMKDDLKDKNTFFKNKILPSLNDSSQYSKRDAKWNDDMSIVDYCKIYFGASMPEDKYPKCEFTSKEIETNMQNIVKLLDQADNLFSAKIDFSALEAESKKTSAKQTTASSTDTNNNSTNNNDSTNSNENKNESYYSELYATWLNEIDITMGEKPNNANGENSSTNEEATALKNYIDCYKDIILAKMTASEFIIKELFALVNAHIQSHMSPDQKKAEQEQAAKDNNGSNENKK